MWGLLLVASTGAATSNCGLQSTTYDINQCLMADQEEAEIELTAAYRRALLAASRADRELDRTDKRISNRLALVQAQRAWITFRDAHCQTMAFTMRGGSGEGTAFAGCLAEMTQRRIAELRELGGR